MGGRDIGVVSMVLTLGWGGECMCGVSFFTSSRSSSGLFFSAGVFFSPGFRCVCMCVALAHLVLWKWNHVCRS